MPDLLGDPEPTKRAPPARLRLTSPTVPEAAVLKAVLRLLTLHPRCVYVRRMNAGCLPDRNGRPVRFGFIGQPDLLAMLKGGKTLWIECKRKGEKPTTDQQAFIDLVNKHGGQAIVAYSIDDVLRELK